MASASRRATGGSGRLQKKTQDVVPDAQHQVQEKAGELKDEASWRLRDQVDQRSTMAGEQVHAVGRSLRKSSEQLHSEGKAAPARLVEQVAERAESLGSYLRDADAERIIRDLESFARRRPWVAGAAGVVAGFTASRFLKASSQGRYESGYARSGLGTSDGGGYPAPVSRVPELAEGRVR